MGRSRRRRRPHSAWALFTELNPRPKASMTVVRPACFRLDAGDDDDAEDDLFAGTQLEEVGEELAGDDD